METSASFEARSAPSSYPTSSQTGFRTALRRLASGGSTTLPLKICESVRSSD